MILYVRRHQRNAEKLVASLGLAKSKTVMAVGVGSALTGHLFDRIIFDVDVYQMSYHEQEKYLAWQDTTLAKLKPKGKAIFLQ